MRVTQQSHLSGAQQIFELQMKRRRLIAAIALFILLELSTIGTTPFGTTRAPELAAQGDLLRQIILLGAFGLLLFVPTNARPQMKVPVSILILLGYCLLSTTWALDPMISLRRLIFTALVILILVRTIGDLGVVRTLNLIRTWLVILLVLNYCVALFTPFGIHGMSSRADESIIGDWRGIMSHKNTAGAATAFTILLFVFDRRRIPMALTVCVVAVSSLFLLLTNSKTSIGMLAVAGAAGALMYWYNPRHRSMVVPIGITMAIGLASLAVIYLGAIQNILDDPTSFTGRTQIWPLLFEYAGENLWTGAGYMSFWQIGEKSPIWTLTNNWIASTQGHGHNGFLDILVTLGLPGLILTVAVVFIWPALKLLFSTDISRARRSLIVSIMVFALGHNMMESTLLDRVAVVQIFLMAAIIMVHRMSSQSAGAHHMIRHRMMRLTQRKRKSQVRGAQAEPLQAGPAFSASSAGDPRASTEERSA